MSCPLRHSERLAGKIAQEWNYGAVTGFGTGRGRDEQDQEKKDVAARPSALWFVCPSEIGWFAPKLQPAHLSGSERPLPKVNVQGVAV
ncbi:hypothetical protein MRX96_014588 [Rhipicephalus microplus]